MDKVDLTFMRNGIIRSKIIHLIKQNGMSWLLKRCFMVSNSVNQIAYVLPLFYIHWVFATVLS